MKYIIIDAFDKSIKRWGNCPTDMLAAQATCDSEIVIEDIWDLDYSIYTDMSNGTPGVSASYILAARMRNIRQKRDGLLTTVDIIHCNAERWASMSDEVRNAWTTYKQVLRDFPENCDPENPVWPMPPE